MYAGTFWFSGDGLVPFESVLARQWMTDLTICGRVPFSFTSTVFLTGGSLLAPAGTVYCCTAVRPLHTSLSFCATFFLSVERSPEKSNFLLSSFTGCTNMTFVLWAPAALPVNVSIAKSSLSVIAIAGSPFRISSGQLADVRISARAYWSYKSSKSL